MNTPRASAAFSLLELLVVIAIMAVIASAGVMALGGAGGRGPQSAASIASSVFNLARTEAIMRGTDTFVLVDTTYNAAKPDNYLRRMTVADATGNLLTRWTTLPAATYFNQDLSAAGSTNFAGSPQLPSGTYAFYKFRSNGQIDNTSGAKFVVSPGTVNGGTFQEIGTGKRYGFKIHKMGKLTFYDDPASITSP